MNQNLLLGFPLPVTLALGGLFVGLLGLVRVLVSLGKPGSLRIPLDRHDAAHPAELEHQAR